MGYRLSIGRAGLVARQHGALAVAQPPLGEELELVRRAVRVEPLMEGLEGGVVTCLARVRVRVGLGLGSGSGSGLGLEG